MTSLFDAVKAKAKAAWQYAGQVPAGLIQSTVANTALPTDRSRVLEYLARGTLAAGGNIAAAANVPEYYRPAIVETPGVLAAIAQMGGNYVAPKAIAAPKDDSYAGRSVRRMSAGIDRTNKQLGIEDPKNAGQVALNIAGSLAIPVKVPGATAANKYLRFAQNVGRVGAEAVVPGRQLGVKGALATAVPLGVGIKETVEHYVPSEGYSTLFPRRDAAPVGDDDPYGEALAVDPDPYGESFVTGDIAQPDPDPYGEGIGIMAESGAPIPINPADQEEFSMAQKGLIGTGILAAALLSPNLIKWGMNKLNSTEVPEGTLVGSRVVKSRPMKMKGTLGKILPEGVQNKVKRAETAFLQADEPVRSLADEFFTPAQASRVRSLGDRLNLQAIGAKVRNVAVTGELPSSAVKAEPYGPLLDAVSALTPAERQILDDGLLARTALDDIDRTGTQATFNVKPDGTPITPADLRRMSDLVENDPKLKPYADAVRKQYRAMLEFRLDRGLLTPQEFDHLRYMRPNYVHTSRDLTREGGDNAELFTGRARGYLDEQLRRAEDEFSGVQAGATRSPIDEIHGRWAATVRQAEMNEHKLEFLDNLSNKAFNELVPTNDGTKVKLISELDEAPNDMTNVHVVYDQGRARYFKIGDQTVSDALDYKLPARAHPILSTMRQISQSANTGALNALSMFNIAVTPLYDTMSTMLFRPAGIKMGVLNEFLNKNLTPKQLAMFDRLGIDALDPTGWLAAPIGALRRGFDGMTLSIANNLTNSLIQGDGVMFNILGRDRARVEAVRDVFQKHYNASIRSWMDREGVSSSMQYGGDTGRSLGVGVEEFAPQYYRDLSHRARDAALKGDHTFVEGLFANSKNAWAQAKASPLARIYTSIVRNMQEGTKYSLVAANKTATKSQQELEQLASIARRGSVDAAQHGGSQAWNKIADSVMYANLSSQALGQLARTFTSNPVGALTNISVLVGSIAAMRYGSMIADPEVRQKVLERTDQQNATAVPLIGGIDLNIEPLLRLFTAPIFAFIDKLAMDQYGNFNTNFMEVIEKWIDDTDENSSQNERVRQGVWDSFKAAGMSALPVTPGAVPGFNAALVAAGIDPGMTRVSGTAQPIREQRIDPTAGEGKTTHSALSAQMEAVINQVIGAGVYNMVHAADEWQRAAYAQNADGSRANKPIDAVQIGLSTLEEGISKNRNVVTGMLFQDNPRLKSIANTDFAIYKNKKDGVDKAFRTFGDLRKAEGFVSGVDPRFSLLNPVDVVQDKYIGTPMAQIGGIVIDLNRRLRETANMEKDMARQVDTIRNQRTTTAQERTREIAKINERRRFLYSKMLLLTRQAEDRITNFTGKPFTFQNFDPTEFESGANQPVQ